MFTFIDFQPSAAVALAQQRRVVWSVALQFCEQLSKGSRDGHRHLLLLLLAAPLIARWHQQARVHPASLQVGALESRRLANASASLGQDFYQDAERAIVV